MAENMMASNHKATNYKFRTGHDEISWVYDELMMSIIECWKTERSNEQCHCLGLLKDCECQK